MPEVVICLLVLITSIRRAGICILLSTMEPDPFFTRGFRPDNFILPSSPSTEVRKTSSGDVACGYEHIKRDLESTKAFCTCLVNVPEANPPRKSVQTCQSIKEITQIIHWNIRTWIKQRVNISQPWLNVFVVLCFCYEICRWWMTSNIDLRI